MALRWMDSANRMGKSTLESHSQSDIERVLGRDRDGAVDNFVFARTGDVSDPFLDYFVARMSFLHQAESH